MAAFNKVSYLKQIACQHIQSINQSINQVYYFSSTLQARFHNKQ